MGENKTPKKKMKSVLISPQIDKEIKELVAKGYFNTEVELIRYAILKVINEYKNR